MNPKEMRGIELIGHGGPEMLVWNEAIPVPRPGPGDVLVRVAAAGVNNTDINTRIGWYSKHDGDAADAGWGGSALSLPRIQGADAAGEIVAVGDGVSGARIGERVLVEPCLTEWDGAALPSAWYLGSECDGAFAEYLRIPSVHAHRIETALSDVELASFPCSYSTAENLLTRARVAGGDRVLITGASGGVGSAAIQLARARGAEVVAVTSPAKADALTALGASDILFRDDDPVEVLGESSVDAVIDLVGGAGFPRLLDVMAQFGRYAVSGAIGGPIVDLDLRTLYLKDLTFYGCTVLELGVFAALVKRIEAGEVRPLVAATYPLKEIGTAQAAFQEKAHTGKIVLTVAEG